MISGFNQVSSSSWRRITGIRLCIGAMSALGSVVMMAWVGTSSLLWFFQVLVMPAKAKRRFPLR